MAVAPPVPGSVGAAATRLARTVPVMVHPGSGDRAAVRLATPRQHRVECSTVEIDEDGASPSASPRDAGYRVPVKDKDEFSVRRHPTVSVSPRAPRPEQLNAVRYRARSSHPRRVVARSASPEAFRAEVMRLRSARRITAKRSRVVRGAAARSVLRRRPVAPTSGSRTTGLLRSSGAVLTSLNLRDALAECRRNLAVCGVTEPGFHPDAWQRHPPR